MYTGKSTAARVPWDIHVPLEMTTAWNKPKSRVDVSNLFSSQRTVLVLLIGDPLHRPLLLKLNRLSISAYCACPLVMIIWLLCPYLWRDKIMDGVCPSVRPLSVCHVPRPNSRTERPGKPTISQIDAHHYTGNQWTYLEVKVTRSMSQTMYHTQVGALQFFLKLACHKYTRAAAVTRLLACVKLQLETRMDRNRMR